MHAGLVLSHNHAVDERALLSTHFSARRFRKGSIVAMVDGSKFDDTRVPTYYVVVLHTWLLPLSRGRLNVSEQGRNCTPHLSDSRVRLCDSITQRYSAILSYLGEYWAEHRERAAKTSSQNEQFGSLKSFKK